MTDEQNVSEETSAGEAAPDTEAAATPQGDGDGSDAKDGLGDEAE